MIYKFLVGIDFDLNEQAMDAILDKTEGMSGSDIEVIISI